MLCILNFTNEDCLKFYILLKSRFDEIFDLLLNLGFIYLFALMIEHRKPRLIQTESRSYKALLIMLRTERSVNSHTYNKTDWMIVHNYLETYPQ
jgi:hypothetical protein